MELGRNFALAENGAKPFPLFLNQCISLGKLQSFILDETVHWLDAGTPQRLLEAALAVKHYQESSGVFAGSIEEAAFGCALIDAEQLHSLSAGMPGTEYGKFLEALARESITDK